MASVVSVIGDIVESRKKAHRSDTQRDLERALERTNDVVPSLQRLTPTVGDEFQGTFATVSDALRATLMVRLFLPESVDCRFGIGRGDRVSLPSGTARIEDGPAWWSARDAIVEAKTRERRANRSLRTWFAPHDNEDEQAGVINAFLVCRDELVSKLDGRGRRILVGTMEGKTQAQIGVLEGITQSAVSQAMARNGSHAILTSSELMERAVSDVDRSAPISDDRS